MDRAFEEARDSLFLHARCLHIALRGSLFQGARCDREEVRDMWDGASDAARTMLLSYLVSKRPRRSKAVLEEVGRCFDRSSVALRDLLLALLRFWSR